MRPQLGKAWCRWLRSVGLPAEHTAVVLDLEPFEVEVFLAAPGYGRPPQIPAIGGVRRAVTLRPVKGDTLNKIRRLLDLGYDADRITAILRLNRWHLAAVIARITPDRVAVLSRPRTRREQLALRDNQRRRSLAAAERAARALWHRCAATGDDAGSPPAIVPTAAELLVMVFEPRQERLPEPTRWNQLGHQRTRWGEENGQAKLTRELAALIRSEHAAGITIAELARRFEVAKGTISAIVKGRTWLEPPDENERDDEPPPPMPSIDHQAAAAKPKARRWQPPAGTPRLGARGSGALHDDS
jgi:hypothetical protein